MAWTPRAVLPYKLCILEVSRLFETFRDFSVFSLHPLRMPRNRISFRERKNFLFSPPSFVFAFLLFVSFLFFPLFSSSFSRVCFPTFRFLSVPLFYVSKWGAYAWAWNLKRCKIGRIEIKLRKESFKDSSRRDNFRPELQLEFLFLLQVKVQKDLYSSVKSFNCL